MSIENYHLKWDSHLTYLNSSIATLYRNDKYSDVLLYSSNPDCGFPRIGIAAHKFILSSSSQFFSSIFDSALSASSGVFHIVLPPELTQRTIQILVQYMYSGEATVPNDILSEVLRGGELLKIRGLCRAAPSNQEVHSEGQKPYPKPNQMENNNSARFPNVMHGIGASVHPEESPVIVKPPNPPQAPQIGLLRIVNVNNLGGGITVNKEVAIDPAPDEEKYCYPEGMPQCLPNVRPSCRESGCTGCPDPADMDCPTDLVQQQKLAMRTNLQRSSQSMEEKSNNEHGVAYRRVSLPTEIQLNSGGKSMGTPLPEEPINRFQNIKEEPSDCWQVDAPSRAEPPTTPNVPKIVLKLKVPRETMPAPIKIETPTSGDDDCSEPQTDTGELMPYTRLICDICKQTFNEPKNWVKHIEGHMEKSEKNPSSPSIAYNQQPSKTPSYVPKKRRRTSPENPGTHVTLMCDLCSRSFNTPAEWVRHINTQHTESELARFNNQRSAVQQKQDNELGRYTRRCHPKEIFKGSARSFHRSPTEIARDPLEICDVLTERFASNSQTDH